MASAVSGVNLTERFAAIRALPPEQRREAVEQLRSDAQVGDQFSTDVLLRAISSPELAARLQTALTTNDASVLNLRSSDGAAGGINIRQGAAPRRAAPTEAAEGPTNDSGIPSWEEPTLLAAQDIRAITGNQGELTMAERTALEFTNLQILEGGMHTDLAANIQLLADWRPETLTEADAQQLDGHRSQLLSPLEQQVLEFTNQQILTCGPKVNLRENYQQALRVYGERQAPADAEALYEAMDGLWTDEDAIMRVLGGKTRGEIAHLNVAFSNLLHSKGESTDPGDYDSNLSRWLDGDLGGGWLEKATDAYNGRPLKDDTEYFWSSAAASWWGDYIRQSSDDAQAMIEHGNLLEQGIGQVNQAIFGAAGYVNDSVDEAQSFYLEKAAECDHPVVQFAAKTGFVLSSIGGSVGTRALDPNQTNEQIEQGMTDVALLVSTFGAGKLVQAGAQTATGMQVLGRISQSMNQVSRLGYSMRRMTGLAKNADDFARSAQQMRTVATSTGNAQRAQRASAVAEAYESAATAAREAADAVQAARAAEEAARAAVSTGTNTERAAQLADDAVRAMEAAREKVEALRLADRAARQAGSQAGALANSAVARGTDAVRSWLASPVGRKTATMRRVSEAMDPTRGAAITDELKGILRDTVGRPNRPMNGAEFNQLMDRLEAFADSHGINIAHTTNTVGVYPNGLNEIRLAGFGRVTDLTSEVSAASRHEVAHIFHTLQTRATLLDAIEAGTITAADANTFLQAIETGSNYRQFEKAVTGAASWAHQTSRTRSAALYADRVESLLDNTRDGLQAGRMNFPTGATFEEVYALMLSKAPAVVGTGAGSLAVRFPPIVFAAGYSANVPMAGYGLGRPSDWGLEGPTDMGFRDFINALVTQGYHPTEGS